jgi:hypothetical protein
VVFIFRILILLVFIYTVTGYFVYIFSFSVFLLTHVMRLSLSRLDVQQENISINSTHNKNLIV